MLANKLGQRNLHGPLSEYRMDVKQMPKANVMTVGGLNALFCEFEVRDDFEIWLSSDEEGNEFLPMLANPELSLAIDNECKRVVLFPSHW